MKDIIQENKGFIRSIIRKVTGSYNEDIEQEVYIKTWRNMQNYHEQGKFKQWLSTLTANVCRDYFRSKQSHERNLEITDEEVLDNIASSSSQEEVIDLKTRQKMVLKAVDELPSKMRKVVILFEFEEMEMPQIADKLGIPLGTVKSRLFNARQILSQKLACLKGE
ncbi:MAG: sigma-70 family RNA polymerase sigma factor [Alphaproteobacteria bacterium]|nr:sigma-70 family RNA polymerase sigma factor [Alphaproteobacteria bacterium]